MVFCRGLVGQRSVTFLAKVPFDGKVINLYAKVEIMDFRPYCRFFERANVLKDSVIMMQDSSEGQEQML